MHCSNDVSYVMGVKALLLQNGFEQLRNKEDPRKRADLLRYIEKMEEPLVCPYCLNIE